MQLLTGLFIARLPEEPILQRSEAHRLQLRIERTDGRQLSLIHI